MLQDYCLIAFKQVNNTLCNLTYVGAFVTFMASKPTLSNLQLYYNIGQIT